MAGLKYLKGALHLHTTLSHDGKLSLDELAIFLRGHGYDFICITEHSYDINRDDMLAQSEKCAQLSSSDFLIIPGIEFRCHDDIDILGYGVIEPIESDDPVEVIAHIRKYNGVPVLAHPMIRNYPLDSIWVSLLDGAEIWNNGEGKYLPQARTLKKFSEFLKWQPKLKAFFGIDLHRPTTYFPIATMIQANENNRIEILKALGAGEFHLQSPYLSMDSSGKPGLLTRIYIIFGSSILNLLRKFRS
jgi:hypothetical protein